MIRTIILFSLVIMANANNKKPPQDMQPMMREAPTCSCEEEIRHCDRLLAEKDKTCVDSRRESFQQCDDLLQASKEASVQAHAAHQEEMQKLTNIITQIRGQKDTIHSECERRVAESYSQGWREAEVQYEEQLTANKQATLQSRTAHETEIQRLSSIITQLREHRENNHTECERRVTESYSLGLNEADAAAKKQLDKVERQLSTTRVTMQLRNEYLTAEKARLEKENRELRQASSRAQKLLLETQRDLAQVKDQLEAKWMVHYVWDVLVDFGTAVWKSFLAKHVQTFWDKSGKERWQKYGVPVLKYVQIVYTKCTIHGPLVFGLLADVSKTLLTEIVFIIRDLPETIPKAMENMWKALEPLRTETFGMLENANAAVWNKVTDATATVSTKATYAWALMKEELHLEELEPHIQAMKKQKEKLDKILAPYLERANRVWQNFKNDSASLWQTIKKEATASAERIFTFVGSMIVELFEVFVGWRDDFVEEFSLSARTVFLLSRVYEAPKAISHAAQYCHEQPEDALWGILKVLLGFAGYLLLKRILFPIKRKRLSQRKVQFAVTQ